MDLSNATSGAFWRDHFNGRNIIEYAQAARELSYYLRVLFEEGYDSVVVPSRGAWPVLQAAQTAWSMEQSRIQDQEQAWAERMKMLMSPLRNVTLLPFSADPQTDLQTPAAIRRYWSHVLAAIVRRNGRHPYLLAYTGVNKHLANRQLADVLPKSLPSERFVFIDTVVSGRAISEIASAFEEAGLDKGYLVLIVDNNGESIIGRYKALLDQWRAVDRCTLIPVKNLFTEDRGPAVSGIWSTVYPQFLEGFQRHFGWNAYGAGSFYHRVRSSLTEGIGNAEYNMPVTKFYASLSVAIYTALSGLDKIDRLRHDVNRKTEGRLDKGNLTEKEQDVWTEMEVMIDYQLGSAWRSVEELPSLSPLLPKTTRMLAEPRVRDIHPSATISISSSHLVRVEFPKDLMHVNMHKIEQVVSGSHDVFDDPWFL